MLEAWNGLCFSFSVICMFFLFVCEKIVCELEWALFYLLCNLYAFFSVFPTAGSVASFPPSSVLSLSAMCLSTKAKECWREHQSS